MVQEHDENILKHLRDIKVKMSEGNPMVRQSKLFAWIEVVFIVILLRNNFGKCYYLFQGFSLEFHFEPNEYFSNTVLTKEYEMKCVPEEGDPFSFEGPEIIKCKGYADVEWI